ncbi:MAG TPA: GNAT family N-acetyltransferase [Rudaea sp.]|nr:GNAT family N-acetyltransferase [Rudaea sp.]
MMQPTGFGSSRRPPPREPLGASAQRSHAACERVAARDGSEFVLRRIDAGDVAALQRGFSRLTPEEVRLRFQHPLNELPRDLAVRLCDLDPRYAVAWVLANADDAPSPEIHAVARVHVDPVTYEAEFALVVQQRIAGQGFGHMLLKRAIDSARELGAVEVWGDILLENSTMLSICDDLGFARSTVAHHPGVQRVRLAL